MQATPDDGLWKARKFSWQLSYINPLIQTWNQDIYLEICKNLNKII